MHRSIPARLLAALVLPLSCVAVAQTVVNAPASPVGVEPRYAGWPSFGRDPSHSGISPWTSQTMTRILWQTPVDLNPQYNGPYLLIHYGTPLVTPGGTLIVTVKTGASGAFQVEGRNPKTGALLWTQPTGWIAPSSGWFPAMGCCVSPLNQVAIPGPGGTVVLRGKPDAPAGPVRQVAFFGDAAYAANPAGFDGTVFIDTPITTDSRGNLWFGFIVSGSPPIALQSGIARIGANGTGSWISAAAAANDPAMGKVPINAAIALSRDEASIYSATSGGGTGDLVKLNSTTLAPQASVRLHDPRSGLDALIFDEGTSSPMVGPDGDVYYGVLENPFPGNNDRGWLLHYDGSLATVKIPGAFGWDNTPSVVPASAVPSYAGTSPYLVLSKYNNYGGIGTGTGLNKVAVLDPFVGFTEPVSGATTMNEVLTILGPTPDPNYAGGVREWCINAAAVDVARHSAIINCEDGRCYRWDFATNTLVEAVTLTAGIGEAYTMTIIGPGGVCFAINNGILFALGS